MIDHHETARRVEVLGEGTQAQRREALVARLKRELQERFNYLPTRQRMWRPAGVIVDGTVDGAETTCRLRKSMRWWIGS